VKWLAAADRESPSALRAKTRRRADLCHLYIVPRNRSLSGNEKVDVLAPGDSKQTKEDSPANSKFIAASINNELVRAMLQLSPSGPERVV
jgi:hypothetical protein